MSRVIPNISLTTSTSTIKDTLAPINANTTDEITKGATNFISKSCFFRFKILVVIVEIEFTNSPLTLAISNDKPIMLRVGTRATAEPSPAIAKIVERITVVKK